jgi:hypothetical protein
MIIASLAIARVRAMANRTGPRPRTTGAGSALLW